MFEPTRCDCCGEPGQWCRAGLGDLVMCGVCVADLADATAVLVVGAGSGDDGEGG